ncbi:hypothetical protein VNI00_018427 [Paramarasmius palmivorus]|uniref:HECT domain-containing protein n=1 Tax=Paramarasmius palmivorus TaxID=297713 RepID=A0AAW0AYY9_9AGAR
MPCTDCSNTEFPCVQAVELTPGICAACGHAVDKHITPPPVTISLPPKGGFGPRGCIKFFAPPGMDVTGQTRCCRPVASGQTCGAPYMAHTPLNASPSSLPEPQSIPAQREPQADRALPWSSPNEVSATRATLDSTNDRRRQSYQTHSTASVFSTKGAQSPRQPRQSYPAIIKAAKVVKAANSVKKPDEIDIYFLPEGVQFNQNYLPSDYDYDPPVGLKFYDMNMRPLGIRLESAGLKWKLTLPERGTPPEQTLRLVDDSIVSTLSQLGARLTTDVAATGIDRGWGAIWGPAPRQDKAGNVLPRAYRVHMPANAVAFWENPIIMKFCNTVSLALGLERPSMFVAPLQGPISFAGHYCVGPKVFHGFIYERRGTDEPPSSYDCFRECSPQKDTSQPFHYRFPQTGKGRAHSSKHSDSTDQANDQFIEISDESDLEYDAAVQASIASHQREEAARTHMSTPGATSSSIGIPAAASASAGHNRRNRPAEENLDERPAVRRRVEQAPSPLNPSELLDTLLSSRPTSGQCIRVDAAFSTVSTEAIVEAFYFALLTRFGGEPAALPRHVVNDVEIYIPPNDSLALLLPWDVTLPRALGSSPPKAFLSALVEYIGTFSACFRESAPSGHAADELSNPAHLFELSKWPSANLKAEFEAIGFVSALALIQGGYLPPNIALAYFQALAGGAESVDDPDWLRSSNPTAACALMAWPTDHSADVPHNEATMSLAMLFDRQPCDFNHDGSHIERRATVRKQIAYQAALNLPIGPLTFEDHFAIQAFRRGFNWKIGRDLRILDAFGTQSKKILREINGQFPTHGDDVKRYINWVSSHQPLLNEYETRWKERFYRYLSGVGHVCHPLLEAGIIPPHVYAADREDPGVRARRFLRYFTGDEILPSDNTTIKIEFAKQDGNAGEEPPPIHVKACFKRGTVRLHPSIMQMLDEVPETDDQVTSFDVYLHALFFSAGASGFETV